MTFYILKTLSVDQITYSTLPFFFVVRRVPIFAICEILRYMPTFFQDFVNLSIAPEDKAAYIAMDTLKLCICIVANPMSITFEIAFTLDAISASTRIEFTKARDT